jgi:pimeloyl-ACP methyl ester carboxylesterase
MLSRELAPEEDGWDTAGVNGSRLVEGTRSQWLDVGDIRIHACFWGGDDSDCIVFLHPTGFLGAIWKPVIDRLRGLGFEGAIWTFDQRGHGLSSKPDTGYHWSSFEQDAASALDQLNIIGALAVGHSAGATTLAGVAAQYPDRIRRLVMIDPILFDAAMAKLVGAQGEHPMAARTRTRRLVWGSREELYASYRDRQPYAAWTEEALQAYVDFGTFDRPDGEIELLCPGRLEAQVYEGVGSVDGFERVARVEIPLLMVRGEKTDSFPKSSVDRAVAAMRNGRFVEMEGCGHFMPMEQPDRIAELIVAESRA